MAQFPCSRRDVHEGHPKLVPGKMANGYVSYYYPEDRRWSFYTRWCMECFMEDIFPTLKQAESMNGEAETTCVICSQESEDVSQTFLTLFPPKMEERQYILSTCPDCRDQLRSEFAHGGKPIEDRNARVGAQSQAPTTTTAWAELLG